MYSQAINTIRFQNGSFLTSMSLTGVEDRYYSFSFIQTAAFPPSTITQGDLCVPDKGPTLTDHEV